MLTIIVPTYNECSNIVQLVVRLDKALAGHKYEVLFVDDDSQDGTVYLIWKASQDYPVSVIVRKGERGLATAVLLGVKHAHGDVVCVMDADLQHPPEMVPKLLQAIEVYGADFAIGSRYVPGGSCPDWGVGRKVISHGATLLAHLTLPITRRVHDPMSGFFMFQASRIKDIEFRPIGYKIMLEMLVLGHFRAIREVPFIFKDRTGGASKMRMRQQIDYLRHLLSLRRRIKRK